MADQENKEYLLLKKRQDITEAERQSLIRPLGIAGLPFPTADLVKNEKGEYVYEIFIVQDARKPVTVFSDRTIEEVTGDMYREMPVPAMMYLSQEILEHTDPRRGDRVLFLLGDSGWGKSHEFKKIARQLHPEGAIVVDMGGMNAQELIWKTVIDYGKGVRELFDKRLKEGLVSDESLKLLEDEFPGSVVRKQAKGGLDTPEEVSINWDLVGSRRQRFNEAEQKMETIEDRGAAVQRAKEIMQHIYETEKIALQSNSFGIKTVKGELVVAWETKRPFLADEITKAIPSTLNSLQSVLEVMNNNNESYRAVNPIPESGQRGDNDSPPFIEIRASDMGGSFLLGLAGNEASDGVTTFALSKSTSARTVELHVGDAQAIDWAHRTSQVLSGLPVTTLNYILAKAIEQDPTGYPGFLIDLRTLGLTADQINAIPPHQIEALKRYDETAKASKQMAELWYIADRMSKEDPELMKQDAFKDLVEELSEYSGKLNVTPRKIIQIVNKSLHHSPKSRPVAEAKVNFNIKATLANLDTSVVGNAEPAWRTLGENASDAIRKDLANMTVGMRKVRSALMKLAEENGIMPPDFKEAAVSDTVQTVASLLKFDEHKDAGGSAELQELRSIILTALRAEYKNLRKSDDTVLPMDRLASAVKLVQEQKKASEFSFVVPNNNIDQIRQEPLVVARAMPVFELEEPEKSADFELVDFHSVLDAFILPQFFEQNRERMWPTGFVDSLIHPPKNKTDEKGELVLVNGQPVPDIEPYKIAEGKGEWGLNMTIVSAADKKGDPVNLWVIEDKTHLVKAKDPGKADWHRYMVVGPEPITSELEVALAEKGISYVVKTDPASIKTINDFLIQGARVRGEDGQLDPDAAKGVTEAIVKAFAVMHTLPRTKPGSDPRTQIIPADATLGEMIQTSNDAERPALFVSIVKPRVAAPGIGR